MSDVTPNDAEIVAAYKAEHDAAEAKQLEIRLVDAKAEVEGIETRLAELTKTEPEVEVEEKSEPKVEPKPEPKKAAKAEPKKVDKAEDAK